MKKCINGVFVEMTSEEIAEQDAKFKKFAEDQQSAHVQSMRERRNDLLLKSDFTQFNDSPLSDASKIEWGVYRQALRDITKHSNWPNLVDTDWPIEPE